MKVNLHQQREAIDSLLLRKSLAPIKQWGKIVDNRYHVHVYRPVIDWKILIQLEKEIARLGCRVLTAQPRNNMLLLTIVSN